MAHADIVRAEQDQQIFSFWPKHNRAILDRLESKHLHVESEDPLEADMILNMGPQHPATHGVLRALIKLDGETVDTCVLDLGYLHRGIEKLAEHKTYQEFMPYTDRMDYLSPYSNNVAFCLAVETSPLHSNYHVRVGSDIIALALVGYDGDGHGSHFCISLGFQIP